MFVHQKYNVLHSVTTFCLPPSCLARTEFNENITYLLPTIYLQYDIVRFVKMNRNPFQYTITYASTHYNSRSYFLLDQLVN